MTPGTRVHFDRELAHLREMVLELGGRARRAVVDGMAALTKGDADLAREVIAEDVNINRLRYDIEIECYTLLVAQQPVASDMRSIVAALTIASDLERIADHGKTIARIYLRLAGDPWPMMLDEIQTLCDEALAMLDHALQAVAMRDVAAAESISRDDDTADAQYKHVLDAIVRLMVEDPRRIPAGTHLIQVAHELERTGDRATNIAERVIYSVTGQLIELNL